MNMKSLSYPFSCFSNSNHAGQLLLLLLLQVSILQLIFLPLLRIDLLRIDAGRSWIRQIVLDPRMLLRLIDLRSGVDPLAKLT